MLYTELDNKGKWNEYNIIWSYYRYKCYFASSSTFLAVLIKWKCKMNMAFFSLHLNRINNMNIYQSKVISIIKDNDALLISVFSISRDVILFSNGFELIPIPFCLFIFYYDKS